jgi:hypothetical protein
MKLSALVLILGASLGAVTAAMAESMANHDGTSGNPGGGTSSGNHGSANDGPIDPTKAWNYDPSYDPKLDPDIDPAHVIQWHDVQPDTEGNLFDYGPVMDDDGADTEE